MRISDFLRVSAFGFRISRRWQPDFRAPWNAPRQPVGGGVKVVENRRFEIP